MLSGPTRKQPVFASRAIVTANHPAASAAGLTMLAAGGNVADAAVATIFTCAVVEPQMVGPLGGGYIVHRSAEGTISVIDNYAEGPQRAREDMYRVDDSGTVVDDANATGHLAAGIPGALKGWFALHQLKGSLPIKQVLAPAISAAEHGFPISRFLKAAFDTAAPMLSRYPESARVFLPRGRPPEVGEIFRNPDLAESLSAFSEEGPDVLYRGRIGAALLAEMGRGGGLISESDLAQYDVRHPEAIRGSYRGHEIIGTPFSSGGGFLNQLGFNILEHFDLKSMGFGTARYWHVLIETLKLMFADRNRYLGDPKFVHFPFDELLDKDYARKRASLIRLDRPADFEGGDPVASRDEGHTTHLTVMAVDGSTVTMTQTINQGFGARVVVPGTGMLLNNTMALFDPRPNRPNSPGPYKRMLTATAATIVQKNGTPAFALGTPGGIHIFPAIFQAIVNVVDHGMNLQEAVEAPRLWSNGNATLIESSADSAVVTQLEAMGHKIERVANVAGNMNGVQVGDASGLLLGASCWRGDGAPVGLSGGSASLA